MKERSPDSPLSEIGERSIDEIGRISVMGATRVGKKLAEALGKTEEEAEAIRNAPLSRPTTFAQPKMPQSSVEIDQAVKDSHEPD